MKGRNPLLDRSIDEEIRHHLLERAERLVAAGMSEADAMREARRRFGRMGRIRRQLQRIGDEDGGSDGDGLRDWLGSVMQDLRLALRSMRAAPGFAAAMILTVALGVGANMAVFSVTDAVLLRPLPYGEPGRLVVLQPFDVERGRTRARLATDRAMAWRTAAGEVAPVLLHGRVMLVMTGGDEPYQAFGTVVTTDWLSTLGVEPLLGRTFAAEESVPGGERVAIVSHELWTQRLGGASELDGQTIELDGVVHTIVGVTPPGLRFPATQRTDVWVPLADDGVAVLDRMNGLALVARVPEGLTLESFEARLNTLGEGLQAADPQPTGWVLRASALDGWRANPDVIRALWVLTAAVGAMLAVAAINAANLLLARSTVRGPDVAVRAALGASRGRLVRQLMTESLVLVAVGGLAAVVLARLMVAAIVGLLPTEVTRVLTGEIAVDGRVLVFALAVTALVGVLVGALPALRATGDAGRAATGGRISAGRGGRSLRSSLVVVEVAVSVMLLVVAGLLARSFMRLTTVDPGYDPGGLLQLSLELPGHTYEDAEARARLFNGLRDELARLPQVRSVSLANGVPPSSGLRVGMQPQVEGEEPRDFPAFWLPFARVDPAFFSTLGATIVAGRDFTEADGRDGDKVIVDRSLATFLFGAASPVGRRFRLDAEDEGWLSVVGVVEDVKLMGQDDRLGDMDLFYAVHPDRSWGFMSLLMRSSAAPEALMPAVRRAVRRLDPDLPVYELLTGRAALLDSVGKPRFLLRMIAGFALIALVLAGIGTYGVLEFAVRQRSREIGVRVALGADARAVRGMVLGHGMRLAVAGLLIGLAGALFAGRLLGTLLFTIEPADPVALATVGVLVVLSAWLACWVPARQATRVDPIEVLRAD